jgi:uncharacterized protein YcaQ
MQERRGNQTMNSRWREYDYFYHTQAIQDEVAHLELAAKIKGSTKEEKGKVRNWWGWLAALTRLSFAFTKKLRNKANQNLVD